MAYLSNFGNMLLLAFGFGFVIFWHELGHFLAAKWADVKVEQFAVGFGQALISWRKGLGFRWGSTQEDFQKALKNHVETKMLSELQLKEFVGATEAQLATAAKDIGISETEYRLNWIPLGGYVKMLGQDDLKPGQTVSDPRSYNNKTISQRMVIVSAGVIMNVILAAIGFMYIFTVGFVVPTPTVGAVIPGSPAQNAYRVLADGTHVPCPLRVGDVIQSLNGHWQSDFEKVKITTALLIAGDPVPIDVVHADGTYDHLFVVPEKAAADSDFPQIGMAPYATLKGAELDPKEAARAGIQASNSDLVGPGAEITAVDGEPVKAEQYYVLDRKLQQAAGKPITVTIKDASGKVHDEKMFPSFLPHFGGDAINFAGMQMLTKIDSITPKSPLAAGEPGKKIEPGDVVIDLAYSGGSAAHYPFPTLDQMISTINKAGEQNPPTELTLTVRHPDGKEISVTAKPTIYLENKKYGFGLALSFGQNIPIISGVLPDSPAGIAKVQPGSKIQDINGSPVNDWFDVNNILGKLKPGQDFDLTASVGGGAPQLYHLHGLTDAQLAEVHSNVLTPDSVGILKPSEYARKAKNIVEAARWGSGETYYAMLQVYQTVRSMSKGNISPKQVSGPLGILGAGYVVAERGTTRLVWFLAIISANLAVMNFLPIPIVDGGLFTFLIIEKIKGSPISPRVQTVAQMVGLALLLSVFVFATWQDVLRLPNMLR